MNADCRSFRRELERVLEHADSLRELSWSEHLLGCGVCRALLEEEEALELLLASLPEPSLPRDLADRVLMRLRAFDPLDEMLERVEAPSVPGGLADGVLASLALDRALDRLPEPEVPEGLAERTLVGLRRHRRRRRAPLLLAAAAALLLITWFGFRRAGRREVLLDTNDLVVEAPVRPEDEELLPYLDVLENWDLLVNEDLDVMLSAIDPADEMLLEWGAEEEG